MPLRCLSGGFLDSLRPYLDIGKRVKNDKGETVDEFVVRQSGAGSTINGKTAFDERTLGFFRLYGIVEAMKIKKPVEKYRFFYCKIIC